MSIKKPNGEQTAILQALNLKTLQGLDKIVSDPDLFSALRSLLGIIAESEGRKIIELASVPTSQDTMVEASIKAALYRGGIRSVVLVRSLLQFVPIRLDAVEESDEKEETIENGKKVKHA